MFTDYNIWLVRAYQKTDKAQRVGQWMFNVLHEMRPELANAVRGGDLDPFYDDAKIDNFLNWVSKNW